MAEVQYRRAHRICVDVGDDEARPFYRRHGAVELNRHWMVGNDTGVIPGSSAPAPARLRQAGRLRSARTEQRRGVFGRGAVLSLGLGMITVAIIEDNRLVREGMTDMLNELPDVKVVLAATSLESAMLKAACPHVVLLDVGLRDKNSLRLAETVNKEMADCRVIVMDLLPVHEEIAEFVNAGVAGFILKDATFEDFVGTIRSVAEGARVLPPRMTGTLFSQIAQVAVRRGGAEALRMTKREREVIALIAVGMSNKEIAQRLNIATDTVKSHVRNVMEKLALHSRLQIAAYAHSQDD
jgi:DNA-binding NarL/FixJ family response regulator